MDVLEGDRHAVVFDVNVYLDVAELTGPPFSWEEFDRLAIIHKGDDLPHPTDRRIDSLRAIAVSASGRFGGTQSLEVWSSDHIDELVQLKAAQPIDAETPELRGLGWSQRDATDLLATLVDDLVYDMSGGNTVGEITTPSAHPPLSYEDACVYTTAHLCAQDDPNAYYHRYLVTRDREVREAEDDLFSSVEIFYPHEWVQLLRRVRARVFTESLKKQAED